MIDPRSMPSGVDDGLLRRLEARTSDAPGRPSIEILAPFTEEPIGAVPASSPGDVAAAVQRARAAQSGWARLDLRERISIFSRFHDLLLERASAGIDLIQLEAGKSRVPAFEEWYDTVAVTRYYMNTGPSLLKPRRRRVSFPGFTKTWEYRHPKGVVANITPWNFPFTLPIADIVPALIAGNAVIIKPDEKTPFSALLGALLMDEAGLPPDVVQVVTGRGEEIGSALVDAVDFAAFTGSTEVGRLVGERAGRRLIGASLELGGKNAAVVLADADLEVAVPGVARGVFANAGQLCISAERLYVSREIEPEFTRRFVDHVRGMEINARYDFSSSMSSMIDREQLEKVQAHVEGAVAAGATLLVGGKPRPDIGPLFYEPTVLSDVDESMDLCRSETFGPVVSIYPFDDAEEAVSKANDSAFGLNFSVWTRDTKLGIDLATRLKAGTVGINDGYAATWSSYDAPLGGMGDSGLSRRHGETGMIKYTEAQTISVQRWIPAFAPLPGMSYERYQRLMGPLLRFLKRLPFYK